MQTCATSTSREAASSRVDGHDIYTRLSRAPELARKPPVLLVHGIGVSSRYMAPLLVRLGEHFRAYAPDLPGFGHSSKPRHALGLDAQASVLAGWMQACHLERAAVFANSFGCRIAVRLAVHYTPRVGRLVLQGPTTDPDASVVEQLARWLRSGRHEPLALNAILIADYLDCGLPRAIATYRKALRDPLLEHLPRVAAPTLVVRGELDSIAPQAFVDRVVRRLPRGRALVIPGGAHALNFSAPDALARAITPFLSEAST